MGICLAALPGDLLVTLLPSVVYPGYDPISQYMSELAVLGKPGAVALALWWPFFGACFIAMGGLWVSTLRAPGLRWFGPMLLCVAGVGFGIVSGLHPCDAGCAILTRSGAIHSIFGLGGLLALVVAPFAFAAAFRREQRWRGLASISVWMGLIGVAGFLFQLMSGSQELSLSAYRGLAQRAGISWSYLWLIVIGVHWIRSERAAAQITDP